MSNRYKGAIISATPPTTTGGESGVASGAWTLEQQMQLQAAGLWPLQPTPKYIEDVFSTYLYTGNGTTQTITNGIDLSTNGGLVWLKYRSGSAGSVYHHVYDSARGKSGNASFNYLYPNVSDPQGTGAFGPTSFNTTGFSLNDYLNESTIPYVSWTWRKQSKFFDIQTWTGSGANRTISHALGSVPACIIVKRTDTTGAWQVYHRSLANTEYLVLNTTAAKATGATRWNSTTPTSSVFSVGTDATVNASGGTYVAYIFAHDAGGFGLTGTDNVISCGSVVGASQVEVNLGYEPQWILVKNSSAAQDWWVVDNMRGLPVQDTSNAYNASNLRPNLSDAETTGFSIAPSATGFKANVLTSGQTYIYIAIRRGPMKVPTTGTSVFSPQIYTEILTNPTTLTTSFATDLHMISRRTGTTTFYVADRLRGSVLGNENLLETSSTAAETDYSSSPPLFTSNTGIVITNLFNNNSGQTDVSYQFRRAPSFMDVVCYTGTGAALSLIYHNLQAVPELIITKARSASSTDWYVGATALGNENSQNANNLKLNSTSSLLTNSFYANNSNWYDTAYYLGTNASLNYASNVTYVAYLFATCAGVSKVGSYTGNGTTQTINCGFGAGGARFVLIKRTDSTGDWYVYDTARGMTVLTDPYLLLNSTAAETATLGSVTTVSTGFAVNASVLAAINTNAASYIFLAIA
jgi:hypothetical protein